MKNSLSHLLCAGTGANSELISAPSSFPLGALAESGQAPENNILLAGGFRAQYAETAHPLSAGLQLNADLTDSDPAELTLLARAELNRHNNQTHRSYILDADPRVTLLGTDATMLHAFMDSYSGILQISPLLLKGYDPALTRAEELHIHRDQHSFTINFTVKQAVDFTRCTYCGDCGTTCPEHCISERLFLDFDRCNLCTECVTICSHDAIELHAIEERSLDTPAIMALEGVAEFLPENRDNIYTPATLPALFASIYSREIEEVINWEPGFCQYNGRLQAGCTLCVDACHHNAIHQDKSGISIDHVSCIECGACLSSCPSGALQYKRFDDAAFLEYFREFPLSPGTRVVIGKEAALHKYWWYNRGQRHSSVFFLEFPQPTALHALHFLLLFAMGARQVLVLGSEAESPTPQMLFCNSLLAGMYQRDNVFTMLSVEELSAHLNGHGEQTATSHIYHDFSYSNRRGKLIEIIEFLMLQKHGETVTAMDYSSEDFGEISCIQDKCTGCMACVNQCRMEALTAESSSYSLKHRPALCIQCGICVIICPETALSANKGLSLEDTFFKQKTLAQADPATCKGCGKIFGTRQSLEKVMTILASKNMWDSKDDLLSYCEDCRVVNLYESLEK